MNFLTFIECMYPIGSFYIDQVLLREKRFKRNNQICLCKKELLEKLRCQ